MHDLQRRVAAVLRKVASILLRTHEPARPHIAHRAVGAGLRPLDGRHCRCALAQVDEAALVQDGSELRCRRSPAKLRAVRSGRPRPTIPSRRRRWSRRIRRVLRRQAGQEGGDRARPAGQRGRLGPVRLLRGDRGVTPYWRNQARSRRRGGPHGKASQRQRPLGTCRRGGAAHRCVASSAGPDPRGGLPCPAARRNATAGQLREQVSERVPMRRPPPARRLHHGGRVVRAALLGVAA